MRNAERYAVDVRPCDISAQQPRVWQRHAADTSSSVTANVRWPGRKLKSRPY